MILMPRVAATLLLIAALLPQRGTSDFIYDDFNTTTGLVMNGDATTSSCDPGLPENNVYAYNERHNVSDWSNDGVETISYEDTSGDEIRTRTVTTNDASTTAEMLKRNLAFGHKDEFVAAQTSQCAVRARLTPSEPSKRGSVWHASQVAAPRGFETSFKFQVSDLSRRCTTVRDPTFSTLRFKSCFVSGGDGFAFVLQSDPKGTKALGKDGESMGVDDGISHALVVEFDTWYNAKAPLSSGGVDSTTGIESEPSQDLFEDHVAVFLTRPLPPGVADRATYERDTGRKLRVPLAPPRRHAISDGRVHTVTIRYYERIVDELVGEMTAAPELLPWLVDGGEGRRVGTLAVWVDAHGVDSNATHTLRESGAPLPTEAPLIAVPINLAIALPLAEGTAWAGFTASTGYAWEKHDILSWYFCEESSCKETRYGRDASGNATEAIQTHLDYAQETKEDGYVPYNTPRANETEGADLQPLSQKP